MDDREIEASLRRQIAVRIPNNYAQIVTAINAGMPIDRGRKSDLPTAFDAWADRLVGDELGSSTPAAPASNGTSRKLLSLFGG